jgi:nucleoside-diphosphate-sugar epimerase
MTTAQLRACGRFVLTGPTGWIGQAMLSMLCAKGDADALGSGDQIRLFGSRAATMALPDGREVEIRPLSEIRADDVAGAHVIHLAYLTKDKIGQIGETEFHRTNRTIDDAVLAAIGQGRPASVFVASSGAASLAESGQGGDRYGLDKLEQEARFLGFAEASGVPVLVGRIFNLAGPHINKLQAYAVSNFALQAMAGGPIRIEAAQPVFRSLLHVSDFCRLVLRAARQGLGRPTPVDLCGMEILEIQDIARLVVDAFGQQVPIERPPMNCSAKSIYLGKPVETRMLALELGVNLQAASVQVHDTVAWMRATVDVNGIWERV